MCTLSWLASAGGGYSAWFNRDELHTRGVEKPPSIQVTGQGISWIAPVDVDSGGTWLMVNAHGLMVCLLNDYGTAWMLRGGARRASRGRLVPLTAELRRAGDAVARIAKENLARTPPFELVACDAMGDVVTLHWDGDTAQRREGTEVRFPRSSSSYQPDQVIKARRAHYPDPVTEDSLAAYHQSHDAGQGAASVNMGRSDASTRSICRVRVTRETVDLDYNPQDWPGAPRSERERQMFKIKRNYPEEKEW